MAMDIAARSAVREDHWVRNGLGHTSSDIAGELRSSPAFGPEHALNARTRPLTGY